MVFRSVLRDCALLRRANRFVVLSVGETGRDLSSRWQPALSSWDDSGTIAFNVPLNDSLAAVEPTTDHSGHLWTTYVKSWTAWNHVRTVTALAAAALFIAALCRANSPFDLSRPKTSSPLTLTTLPLEPQDWPRLFEQHFNAGDLDAVMALYHAEARFVTPAGETLVGRDAIRDVLAGTIAAKRQFRSRVV